MQYSGNPQQQRFLNMMMQARQQEAALRQQSAAAAAASFYPPAGVGVGIGVGVGVGAGLPPHHPLQQRGLPLLPSSLHPQAPFQQHQQQELLFVTRLTDNDVLLGRGTPCAENEGNVRFRRLVKQRKLEYIAAEKRMRKDAIAREILEVIASRGGKFLRKVESKSEMAALGVPASIIQAKGSGAGAGAGAGGSNEVWAIVDEETQVQKVKQALRNKDDTGDLPPPRSSSPSSSQQLHQHQDQDSSHSRSSYMERDVTNRFPRGVVDESNIHKAESNIKFGAGEGGLERASSGSSGEEGDEAKLSSPKSSKKHKKKGILLDSPTKARKETSYRSGSLGLGGLRELPETANMGFTTSPGGVGRADLLGGLDTQRFPGGAGAGGLNPVLRRRQVWDRAQAAASDGELRTIQELQRLRMMREQMGMPMMGPGSTDFMGNPALAAAGAGLDATATMGAGFYGAANAGGLMSAEYRQMQAQQLHAQQLQAQRMVAAREQAAAVASLRGPGPAVHPSAAMAARQLQLESHTAGIRRGSSASALRGLSHQEKTKAALDAPGASSSSSRTTEPVAKGRAGADSAGERAIGIAQAMKRADAFSPTESLELSHLETLILSVLCSHGLPVWTPESNTKAFISLPAFTTKDSDWNWCDFATALKEKASDSEWKDNKHIDDRVVELAMESATEYLAAARELAIKSVMLMEKLRRHGSAAGGGATQRKQFSGLGMRVPLWLDRELSKWAMTLDIADPTGRPVPFSSSDFVADHPGYKENPSIVATAAFDPQLADDVVDQVALLSRLRSIFVKSKTRDVRAKVEAAVKKADAVGEGWEDQPKGWDSSDSEDGSAVNREVLLCDRLLKSGFTGVLTSVSELSPSYTGAASSKTRPCPSFESLGLTKSAIQQRVNQITRELHILDESKDMQDLLGDRMERIAQSVLTAQQDGDESARRDAVARLLAGGPSPGEGTKKRWASDDGSVASQSKKQKSGN